MSEKVEVPLLEGIKTQLVNPIITVLALAAFVVFLWGLVVFIWNSGDDEARSTGKRVMLWGVIGLVIIFGAWSIVELIGSAVGVDPNDYK